MTRLEGLILQCILVRFFVIFTDYNKDLHGNIVSVDGNLKRVHKLKKNRIMGIQTEEVGIVFNILLNPLVLIPG